MGNGGRWRQGTKNRYNLKTRSVLSPGFLLFEEFRPAFLKSSTTGRHLLSCPSRENIFYLILEERFHWILKSELAVLFFWD